MEGAASPAPFSFSVTDILPEASKAVPCLMADQ
jgi:hypothetical protein